MNSYFRRYTHLKISLLAMLIFYGLQSYSYALEANVNGIVRAIAIQANGKIVIGGSFTEVDGIPRNHIARLNADGSLDSEFNPGTGANNQVRALALQDDGKVIIVGYFLKVNDIQRIRIARLNIDGSVDTGFNPGSGANDWVRAVTVQDDGKIIVGGLFSEVNGIERYGIARLNTDGSVDSGFDAGPGEEHWVGDIALQSNGKVIVIGSFRQYISLRSSLIRLNIDGSFDTSFNLQGLRANPNGRLIVQNDDKIILQQSIVRLNAEDGSIDTGYDSGTGANNDVEAMAIQADGKLLVGGFFSQINGIERIRIARLNTDGSLDTTFESGLNGAVYALAVQADGKIIVGGSFSEVQGKERINIARLNSNGSLDGIDSQVNCVPIKAANGNISIICL